MKYKNNIEKYALVLQDNLSTKDIMNLCDVGKSKALEIRYDALKYCVKHNIKTVRHQTPTSAVLYAIDKSIDYYHDKAMKEIELNELICDLQRQSKKAGNEYV